MTITFIQKEDDDRLPSVTAAEDTVERSETFDGPWLSRLAWTATEGEH